MPTRSAASPAKTRPTASTPPKKSASKTASNATTYAWALAALIAAVASQSASLRSVVIKGVNGMGSFPLIDCFHAMGVAYEYRSTAEAGQGTLQRLFAIVITSLGGTTIISFLLGHPCGWLCDNETLTAYIVAWYLMHHMPYDPLYRLITSSPYLPTVVTFFDDISWGVAITKWGMFKAVYAIHEQPRPSAVAALLSGMVAGCGGGLIQQACSLVKVQWAFATPDAFTGDALSLRSGFGIKASACMAALTYCLMDPHGLLRTAVDPHGRAFTVGAPNADGHTSLWHSKEEVIHTAVCVMVCAATVRSTLEKLLSRY